MHEKKILKYHGHSYPSEVLIPDECPRCHFAIKPEELSFKEFIDNNDKKFATGLFLCKHCFQTFVTFYSCFAHTTVGVSTTGYAVHSHLVYAGPESPHDCECPDDVKTTFPRFYAVYNQAHKADSLGLDEIAGMGYRKAVEILVKDYCLQVLTDDRKKESIPSMPLAQCIKLIPYERIKTLALGSAWLGNDETHYERKHTDRDLDDLKRFVKALVFFVSADLAASDASSLCTPKRTEQL